MSKDKHIKNIIDEVLESVLANHGKSYHKKSAIATKLFDRISPKYSSSLDDLSFARTQGVDYQLRADIIREVKSIIDAIEQD